MQILEKRRNAKFPKNTLSSSVVGMVGQTDMAKPTDAAYVYGAVHHRDS